MADPVSGSTSSDTSSGSSGGGWLSDVGNFLSSPAGNVLSSAATVGAGLYNASQANQQAQQQVGQLTAAGAPASSLYGGTIGQLTGGPTVGGPTGQIISGTTGAATGLLQTAEQYASGQLTPAQQQMISQYSAGQNAQLAASLGNRIDSSARTQGQMAIGNNATMMAQALVSQNVQLAQGALQSATSAYNNLVSNALQAGQLGLSATSQAVQTAMQADQQIAQYINQLIAQVAQGLSGASTGGQNTTPGSSLGAALQKLFQGGGGAVSSGVQQAGVATGYTDQTIAGVNQDIGQTQAQVAQSFSDMAAPDIQITDPTQSSIDLASSATSDGGWG